MKFLIPLCAALLAAACGAPQSQTEHESAAPAAVEARNAWAAPTPGGVDVSAGYLTLYNGTDADDHLLRATSPRAERVEVHEMIMDGAVMQMRPVERLTAPAGETVVLAPGGAHLMFYGVTTPFNEGETIPVQLTFENAGVVDVVLPVRRDAPAAEHAQH
jgi:periplasmic copper chaperone A